MSAAEVERRLVEWATWRLEPAIDCTKGQTIMQRIKVDQHNAGASAQGGFHYEVIDGVPCKPDGGVAQLVERMGRELVRDRRAREVEEVVHRMPRDLLLIVQATYVCVHYRDIPRSERDAAEVLKLKKGKYRELKSRMVGWVEARICFPQPPMVAAA